MYLDPRKEASFGFPHEPFYVGKGKGLRSHMHLLEAKVTTGHSNIHRINRIRGILRDGLEPIIIRLYDNLTNEEACIKEIEVINQIGRKDTNSGPLLNLTNGGGGTAGRIYSDETKKKISENHADFTGYKHPSWGLKRSEETRRKIGESKLGIFKHREDSKNLTRESMKQISHQHICHVLRALNIQGLEITPESYNANRCESRNRCPRFTTSLTYYTLQEMNQLLAEM